MGITNHMHLHNSLSHITYTHTCTAFAEKVGGQAALDKGAEKGAKGDKLDRALQEGDVSQTPQDLNTLSRYREPETTGVEATEQSATNIASESDAEGGDIRNKVQ